MLQCVEPDHGRHTPASCRALTGNKALTGNRVLTGNRRDKPPILKTFSSGEELKTSRDQRFKSRLE